MGRLARADLNIVSKDRNKQLTARIVGFKPVRALMALAVRIFVPRQRVGVAVVGFDDRGRILMLNHVYHPIVRWGVPGGWLSRAESPAQCALRELGEETGLGAELGPVVHVSYEKTPPHLGIAYAARIIPGKITLSSEILDAAWCSPEELPQPLLPFVQDAIRSAIDYPYYEMQGLNNPDE